MFLRKWGRCLLACVLYAAAGLLLYAVQYRLFGNVIKTPLLYILIFPVFAWIGWALNGGYPKPDAKEEGAEALEASGIYTEPKPRKEPQRPVFQRFSLADFIRRWQSDQWTLGKKLSFLVSALVLVAATLFMIYALVRDPYTLIIYLYFGVLLVLAIATIWPAKSRRPLSALACLLFLMIIAVTLAFVLIVSPMTVSQGREMLEKEGYDNIYYEKNVPDRHVLETFLDGSPQYGQDDSCPLGFYLYRCEKDGAAMGAVVCVTHKNLVAVEPLDNDSGLSFYMNFD